MNEATSTDAPDPELLRLRSSIDNLDAALVHLLAERFKVTQRVGELKATKGLPAADPQREKRQIERLRALAVGAQLDVYDGLDPEQALRHILLWRLDPAYRAAVARPLA